MALTKNEYDILIVTLSWAIGFLPIFMGRRMAWWQAIGLALVVSPFVRMGVNFYLTIDSGVLFTFTVLQPVSREALWSGIARTLFRNFIVPAAGLLLLYRAIPTSWSGRFRRQGFRDAARANGLAPAQWRHDALHGLTLFAAIALAFAIAYILSATVFSFLSVNGDESGYWRNITIPLIIMLSAVAGLTEEFLFRGILLHRLGRHMSWATAALVQAVLFGLVHAGYGTWTHIVGPFAFGLGMAWVARVLGVTTTAILHAEVNIVFFAVEVSNVLPSAWGLIALLLIANIAAACATRGHSVTVLWHDLTRGFKSLRARPAT